MSAAPLAPRIAIVGAGPSGFYTAEALLRAGIPGLQVDLIERLPVPHGLVRYGVAPDHPKLKRVSAVFERIAAMPGLRFLGGVALGQDVTLDDLHRSYHAVVLATGAAQSRRLGIAGEDLPGCHAAGDFVGWYNGHPDQRDCRFDLSAQRAVVVGHGNVALDIARILLRPVDGLRRTDIAAHALDALAHSRVREVVVVGRRGPAQTHFSPKELHEFGTLASCDALLDGSDWTAHSFEPAPDADAEARAAIQLLQGFSTHAPAQSRRCVFRFHLAPAAISGHGRVQAMHFVRAPDAPAGGELTLDCGLVFASVGRRALPLPGVPYDAARGVHANAHGRIIEAGRPVAGLYVCGWAKRGPQGTIGSNRACGMQTAEAVLADLPLLRERPVAPTPAMQAACERAVDHGAWQRIDRAEVACGTALGKPREKFVDMDAMRAAARPEAAAC
ncbi:FAD-dependent oxidoreductase [Pseudacidovorax intermedius]|uniref:FAD-dependent oxidoreductase n=1 Tax=Pseudacidovorax intermedius TaxID=433924 RepID=UPI0026E9AA5F|nr:FAD-dependent oxidoreductase [Pseudacidovorax intermedius]